MNRLPLVLALVAIVAALPVHAGPQNERWIEHRERRLSQSMENGDVTPKQARRIRQQWDERYQMDAPRGGGPRNDWTGQPGRQDGDSPRRHRRHQD